MTMLVQVIALRSTITTARVLLVAVGAADEYGVFISDSRGLIKNMEALVL